MSDITRFAPSHARFLNLLTARAFRLEAEMNLDMAVKHDAMRVIWLAELLGQDALSRALRLEQIAAHIEQGRMTFWDLESIYDE